MSKTWVPNTGTKPQFIGGKLVHPGEGAFADSPDPSVPVPVQVQSQVNGAGALELVAGGVRHRAMTPSQAAAFDAMVSRAGNYPLLASAAGGTSYGIDVLGSESSGLFLDRSDSGNHIKPFAANTGAYANAGWMSTIAGAGGGLFLPVQKFSHDVVTDSFLFAVTMNMATPGAIVAIAGIGAADGTRPGWYLAARTTGVVVPTFGNSAGSFSSAPSWGANMLGTAADGSDHTLVMAYDAPTRSVYYWLDGAFKTAWTNVVPVPASGPVPTTRNFGLGVQTGAATNTAVAAKWKNLKYRVFPGQGLPVNIGAIAREVTQNPTGLRYLDMIAAAASKYIALAWGPAQSNEYGTSDYPDVSAIVGAPCRDAVGTDGSTSFTPATTYGGSMHCNIAAKAGKRGRWLQTYNTAVGGSSSAHYWCGMFVSWSASKIYGRGAYCIASGNIYKMTASSGVSTIYGTSGGSQPTWPGSGTVTDNEITWTYVRAATAADVVGTVLDKDHPLFDPNGAFAALKTKLDGAAPSSERWMAVSVGQTDASIGLSQAAYTAALVNAARWGVAQGYKVLVGLTCSAVPAGTVATWMASTGKPGWQAALAQLATTAGVYAGADLYTGLGDLSVTADGLGLQADGNQVHMNSLARDTASGLWDAALAAAGA